MSLMFFLSGVFVPGSLSRKGGWSFLSDRLLRIGLPLAVVVVVVMPVAYYPAYVVTAADPSVAAFWQHWTALPFWPCGPQWFLCQLAGAECACGRAASLRAGRDRAPWTACGHARKRIRSASLRASSRCRRWSMCRSR